MSSGGVVYGSGIAEVSADITIPKCEVGLPKRGDWARYTSNGWIGLSAYAKQGLIQTGITCTVNATSPAIYKVWTEWAPAYPVFYNATDFKEGDVIRARVVGTSPSSGYTSLENTRTGQQLETQYTNQTHELQFTDVEWITESQPYFNELGPQGTLGARFEPWVFSNAVYQNGSKEDNPYDLRQPDTYTIDTNLKGFKIASGQFICSGKLETIYTTPDNYTIPGLLP